MTVRVLVADDQELVRSGLALIVASRPGLEVVGQAADDVEAVELARTLRPDVVLMDVRMPRLDGIEATRQLAALDDGGPAVVVITTFDLEEHVRRRPWADQAEIGAELYVSLGTVKTHLGGLMTKLGVRNRVELAIWAFETGRAR
ncbi:response regulator transcription factor [Xylanimonas sp. McL0601]|uniref:response regulator transcription factor n=1 Tax=Xylanimonas sp. McL0601 TaxID=3414739 RepID=UPI003CF5E719